MQPYAVVVVRDQTQRQKLAEKMLAANVDKVKTAPVVAVFAADTGKFVVIHRCMIAVSY